MNLFICTVNILGWPIIQLGIARWMLSRPSQEFQNETWLTRPRNWETRGLVYRRLLLVPRWKHLLPDGADWLGGVRQKDLVRARTNNYLLIAETRRAELAHWYMLLFTPVFFLWNPLWVYPIMLFYGAITNLPCILSQRFNRSRLTRGLAPTGPTIHRGDEVANYDS